MSERVLKPGTPVACPYCGLTLAPRFFADFDGLNFHCAACDGHLGVRPFADKAAQDVMDEQFRDSQ